MRIESSPQLNKNRLDRLSRRIVYIGITKEFENTVVCALSSREFPGVSRRVHLLLQLDTKPFVLNTHAILVSMFKALWNRPPLFYTPHRQRFWNFSIFPIFPVRNFEHPGARYRIKMTRDPYSLFSHKATPPPPSRQLNSTRVKDSCHIHKHSRDIFIQIKINKISHIIKCIYFWRKTTCNYNDALSEIRPWDFVWFVFGVDPW